MLKDANGAPLVPGQLYWAVADRMNWETGRPAGFDDLGLYWYASDDNFYSAEDNTDQVQPQYPQFDRLIPQEGSFDKGYAH